MIASMESVMKCLSLVSILCAMQVGTAETPDQAIDRFIILVHPCPYEAFGKPDTDPYRRIERAACARWFEAIPSLRRSTFAIQVDFAVEGPSPDRLHQAFVDRLGDARVCRIACEVTSPEDPEALSAYYDRIDHQIRQQLGTHALTFDPVSCKTVIWGQSFEGCAAGFGSAIANRLGLSTPTQLDYAMSAPDAPFMLDAKFIRNVWVPDSDIQAYVFDLGDGRCAAFFRACLTPQWLDLRPIELAIDSQRFTVLTKQGDLVWPGGPVPTAEQQRNTRYNQWREIAWPEGSRSPRPRSFTLATVQERYVLTARANMDELVAAIESAVVKAGTR